MLTFIICSLYVFILFFYFYMKTKDILNPFGISLFSFTFVFGLGQLKLNSLQNYTVAKTYIVVFIVTIIITICGLFTIRGLDGKNIDKAIEVKISESFKKAYRAFALLSILCIIFTFFEILISKKFAITEGFHGDRKDAFDFSSSFRLVRYSAEFISFCAVFAYYELLFDLNKSKRSVLTDVIVIILALVYVLFVQMSRGSVLFIFLSCLYLYNYKKRLSMLKLSVLLVLVLIFLTVFFMVRVSGDSAVFQGKAKFGAFNSIYNYLVMGYENLNLLLSNNNDFTIFRSTHVSLAKIFREPPYKNEIPAYSILFYNAKPFIYSFYQDLGIAGIVLYCALIFTLIGYVYSTIRLRSTMFLLLFAIYQKAIFTLFFGNYFFGILSVTNGYYLTLLLILYSNNYLMIPSFRITNVRS